mmetsp:Transcript_45162/g.105307  ORF Transcript_45162/g.105307 Transcript_45162/m.105307 type:complete len:201 (+) Transcript_45162:87-689(+)
MRLTRCTTTMKRILLMLLRPGVLPSKTVADPGHCRKLTQKLSLQEKGMGMSRGRDPTLRMKTRQTSILARLRLLSIGPQAVITRIAKRRWSSRMPCMPKRGGHLKEWSGMRRSSATSHQPKRMQMIKTVCKLPLTRPAMPDGAGEAASRRRSLCQTLRTAAMMKPSWQRSSWLKLKQLRPRRLIPPATPLAASFAALPTP